MTIDLYLFVFSLFQSHPDFLGLFTKLSGVANLADSDALHAHGKAFSAVFNNVVSALNDADAVHQQFQALSSIHQARHVTADHVEVNDKCIS